MKTTPISQTPLLDFDDFDCTASFSRHLVWKLSWLNWTEDPSGVTVKPPAENSGPIVLAQPRVCCDRISK